MKNDEKNRDQKTDVKNDFTHNEKWAHQSAQIRKVQISLDFPDSADILLRTLAARQHKAPSSLVREILGMPSSPPKRARIGVSFNDEELAALGKRYSIDAQNRAAIRRRVTEEVVELLELTEEKSTELSTQAGDVNELDKKIEKESKLASDIIYERFIAMLSKRNS